MTQFRTDADAVKTPEPRRRCKVCQKMENLKMKQAKQPQHCEIDPGECQFE